MENILNKPLQLTIFFSWMLILWLLEFGIPLTNIKKREKLPNILLTIAMLLLNLLFASLPIFIGEWTKANHFGLFNFIYISAWLQLLAGILILDLWAAYVIHLLFHKISWLWNIHSVHHSDTMLDVTTAFRQHPLESILRITFLLIGMFVLGLPLWITLVYQTLSSFNAQLEHANIKMNPKLESILQLIFVTPNYHKIHHSSFQKETNSNYSNIFSIWDRLFSTISKRETYDNIDYGLDYLPNAKGFSFLDLLKLPFEKGKLD